MKKKPIALIFVLIAFSYTAFCQVEEKVSQDKSLRKEKEPIERRVVFGGDIGLSFGTITYIKLAPTVGYRITDRLTAGLGPIYIYQKVKSYYNWETSIYGGKTYGSFTLYQGSQTQNRFGIGDIMLHVENEVVNVEKYDEDPISRIWIDNLLVGGGMYQPIGGRFGVSVFILWDVTQNPYSTYFRQNPIFKFGFNF